MPRVERIAWVLLWTTVVLGLGAIVAVVRQEFGACPDETNVTEQFKEMFLALTDIVKWGIGIASGAVGLFGLQLLQVKEGPKYSKAGQLLLVSIVLAMCCSIYFGLRWCSLVAQAWFLKCPHLVSDPLLQRPFDLHTYFFMGGISLLAVVVVLMLFPPKS